MSQHQPASPDPGSDGAGESQFAPLLRPALDGWNGLDRSLAGGVPALGWIFVGLLASWWIYVPMHEFLHAAACLATGGHVTELQIARAYGGDLWAALVPWVVAGGDYAGRLSGFDTGGSDLVYLATDFGPFLLTLWPGVWWLRRAGTAGRPLLFGASLPFALAPFMSLTGDAFEIGSILVTRLPPWTETAPILRGDDLLLFVENQWGVPETPWVGALLAAFLGMMWAVLTYLAGGLLATALGAGPVPRAEPPPKRDTPEADNGAGDFAEREAEPREVVGEEER